MNSSIRKTILQMQKQKEILVVGIDGLGGAGKSTVSEQICGELAADGIHTILLHMDDFIHPREVRYNSAYPAWQCYYELQWRLDYVVDVIRRLKETGAQRIALELYDKEHDQYTTEQYDITQNTVVLLEGVFLQRKELQGLFDYRIYVDVPESIRLQRVLKRDTYIGNEQQIIDKYKTRYFPAERHYFNTYRPDLAADAIISEYDQD